MLVSLCADNGVLRVPILYGEVQDLGESAVTVLFDKVKETGSNCVMNDYERRYPTHCADIGLVLHQLSDKKLQVKYIVFKRLHTMYMV